MGQAVLVTLKVCGNDFVLQQLIEGGAISLVLGALVVVFALLANGPSIPPVVALGPPAVQNTAIRLAIERGFLAAGATGLVCGWDYSATNRCLQPGNGPCRCRSPPGEPPCPERRRCVRNDRPARSGFCRAGRPGALCRQR